MWCSVCQQDVPGIAHAVTGRMVCPRCQQPGPAEKPQQAARICDEGLALDEPIAAAVAACPPRLDPWETRQRVRELDRTLRRTIVSETSPYRTPHGQRRFDPPQSLLDASVPVAKPPHVRTEQPNPPGTAALPRRSIAGQVFAWLIVLAGSAALALGIGLITWSLSTDRMLYWDLALGLALGGQGTLILGLVLLMSRLWRNSRYAAAKLHDVQVQLGELQHTAETLAIRSPGAPAFYADLVRGASPHVLLANLKGQLDQLATRLSGGF